MIYTLGHTANYEALFKRLHPDAPLKSGRDSKLHKNYPGGSVWKTFEAAKACCQNGYSVYGLNANWGTDTAPSQDSIGGSRDLLKTSKLIQLKHQESFLSFAKSLLKEEGEPKFGCLMAMISPTLSAQFVEWAFDNIEKGDVVPDNGKTGYEDEPHITVLYGFHNDVTDKEVFDYIKSFGPITLTLGKITKFKQDDQDVLKIDVESKDLQEFNALLMDKFADRVTNKYPEYHPHQTLAYVKKGAAEDIDPETFEGFEMTITDLIYSYPDGVKKVHLKLQDQIEEAIYGL